MADHYVHGTHAQEQGRLAKLNELLNERSLSALRLRGGERMLDVGSGLGQLSCAMLRAAGPDAVLVGIERSEAQRERSLALAAAEGVGERLDFRAGDALRLPLRQEEWGSFDLVHTRFLLEHLRDPLSAVRQMLRAAKPNGGRIVLEDDDHELLRLWPRCPPIETLWAQYQKSYQLAGNDPIVGRRLVELLHAAGAKPVRNDWLFFGSCAGEANFAAYVANLRGVLEGAIEAIAPVARSSPSQIRDVLRELDAWATRPDAALWYCMSWAEGVRIEAG